MHSLMRAAAREFFDGYMIHPRGGNVNRNNGFLYKNRLIHQKEVVFRWEKLGKVKYSRCQKDIKKTTQGDGWS